MSAIVILLGTTGQLSLMDCTASVYGKLRIIKLIRIILIMIFNDLWYFDLIIYSVTNHIITNLPESNAIVSTVVFCGVPGITSMSE